MNDMINERKICLNCLYLCRMGNGRFTCTHKDSVNFDKGPIDLDIALARKCDNHVGVRIKEGQTIFYR